MMRSLLLTRRSTRSAGSIPRQRRLQFESLENRRVLSGTTDVAITNLRADPTGFVVEYEMRNQASAPFEIGIYRSSDGVALDQLLLSRRVTDPAQLAVGNRQQFLSANFADVQEDYRLVAVVDAATEVVEGNEANNTRTLDRGVFQASDGTVHVQGNHLRDSVQISTKTLTTGAVVLDVVLSGTNRQFTHSTVTDIHVRTHAGNDTINVASAVPNSVLAYAGDGADTVYGGSSDDLLFGGPGGDTLRGRNGDDTLYGDQGDDMSFGEGGNDYLIGGPGNNQLNGGGQPGDVEGQKPELRDVQAFNDSYGVWTITGTAVDDGEVVLMRVYFSGVMDDVIPVMADGSFAVTKNFGRDPMDLAILYTMDVEGLLSSNEYIFLG